MASVPYIFTLEVDGFDIEDDDVVSRFSADAVEAYPAVADGQVTITYNLVSDHPFDAVLDAINHLKWFDPDISVQRVVPDLVNISDIASRINSSRDTVRSWVTSSRGPGNFPMPYATIGSGVRIWDWSAVNEWLQTNHPSLSEDEHFLSREELDWINASLTRMLWKLQNSSVLISEYTENLSQAIQGPRLNADLGYTGFYTVSSAASLLQVTTGERPEYLLEVSSYPLIRSAAVSYSGCPFLPLSTIVNYGTSVSMTDRESNSFPNTIWTSVRHFAGSFEADISEGSEIRKQSTVPENASTRAIDPPGNSSTSLVAYPSSGRGDRS